MGVLGECFFAAEERGKTRKCWRREFLTMNDTNYTNEGDGVLGDLKFARREQWSVVSGEFFWPRKNTENRMGQKVGNGVTTNGTNERNWVRGAFERRSRRNRTTAPAC